MGDKLVEYDIIIVGSGPAGTSTALHLAQLSPDLAQRTLILERERHPRPKLCGGGILQDAEFILQRLGLDLTKVPHVDVHEARFLFEGRGFCIKREPVTFRVIQRDEFDAWLVDAARARGLVVQEETHVLQVRPTGDAVEVETDQGTFLARAVVGADGSKGVVRRVVSPEPNRRVAIPLEFVVPLDPEVMPPPEDRDRAYFDFSVLAESVQGYVWNFPTQVEGQLMRNRGIYDGRVYPDRPHPNLRTVLREALAGEEIDLDDYALQGHPIHWFDPQGPFSAPGIILVGDAAGVDPTYGEGLSFALGYGELAAQELNGAFARGDLSFAGYRARILKHPMGRCLKRRVRVARLLYGIRSHSIQRLLWWRFGPLLRWYIETFLMDWAK